MSYIDLFSTCFLGKFTPAQFLRIKKKKIKITNAEHQRKVLYVCVFPYQRSGSRVFPKTISIEEGSGFSLGSFSSIRIRLSLSQRSNCCCGLT